MKRIILVPVLITALALAACNANPSEESKSNSTTAVTKGGSLHILTDQKEIDLDPAKSQNLATTTLGLVLRRLTTWRIEPGKKAKVVPDLATNTGKPSDGGKTWTYKLKKGVSYAGGRTVTSTDIKYGIERSFASSLSGGLGYHKGLLKNGGNYKGPYKGKDLNSIETPTKRTIVFHLKTAYGDWPWIASMPAFAPVPKSKDDPDKYGRHPLATGPYQVDSLRQGTALKLKRNPDWKSDTDPVRSGGPKKVTFEMGQDATVSTQKLVADSGDDKNAFGASFVPPSQLGRVKKDPEAKKRLVVSDPGALSYLAMNTHRGALKNLKVRKAIEYAVNKKSYQIAAGGPTTGGLATTLITPGIPGRAKYDLYKAPPKGDVKKAKRLLKQSGHADGLKLSFPVENDKQNLSKAQAIQQSLKRVEIKVKLRPLETTAWTAVTTGNKGKYDLTLSSWQPDFPSANGNIQPLFASSEIGGGGYNLSRYKNQAVDKIIDRATAQTDQDKAQKLWSRADKKIMTDAPVVPLTYTRNAFLHGSHVQNFFVGSFPGYPNYLRVSLKH